MQTVLRIVIEKSTKVILLDRNMFTTIEIAASWGVF